MHDRWGNFLWSSSLILFRWSATLSCCSWNSGTSRVRPLLAPLCYLFSLLCNQSCTRISPSLQKNNHRHANAQASEDVQLQNETANTDLRYFYFLNAIEDQNRVVSRVHVEQRDLREIHQTLRNHRTIVQQGIQNVTCIWSCFYCLLVGKHLRVSSLQIGRIRPLVQNSTVLSQSANNQIQTSGFVWSRMDHFMALDNFLFEKVIRIA